MTLLPLLSDLLLLTATLGLAAFCWVFSKRKPPDPESEPALADRMAALESALERMSAVSVEAAAPAQPEASDPELVRRLQDAIVAADDRIGRLELLLAGLDDMELDLNETVEADAARPPVFQPLRSARVQRSLS